MSGREDMAEAGLLLLDLACDWRVELVGQGEDWILALSTDDKPGLHVYRGPTWPA